MSESLYLFAGTVITVLATMGSTVWIKRRSSPESASTFLSGADKLLTQLQTRLALLEERVSNLEHENAAYYRLYGPLPLVD